MLGAPDTFTTSNGWLGRWKNCHGVCQLKICGEKFSANNLGVNDFKTSFKNIVLENCYALDQIYNCDETGLNYKMLPSKTWPPKQETAAPGHKRGKEYIKLLACCYSSEKHNF